MHQGKGLSRATSFISYGLCTSWLSDSAPMVGWFFCRIFICRLFLQLVFWQRKRSQILCLHTCGIIHNNGYFCATISWYTNQGLQTLHLHQCRVFYNDSYFLGWYFIENNHDFGTLLLHKCIRSWTLLLHIWHKCLRFLFVEKQNSCQLLCACLMRSSPLDWLL